MTTPAAKPGFARAAVLAAIGCAVVAVALFQFFGSAARGYVDTSSLFWWWVSQWIDPNAETGHGWLILGLSAWLFWRNLGIADRGLRIADRQSEIRNPESEMATPLAALLAGLALHAVGFAAQQGRISIVGLLVYTWGVLRLAGGRRWGEAALFPVAFMVFAIPLQFLDAVGFGLWLRVRVVEASYAIAHLFGIGVLRNGTQLVAPDGAYNYDVAAACSGIRSLTAMTALSLLAGYLNFQSSWRRGLVLLLCFPLVYLGNVARIVAIIFAAQIGGPKWGDLAHEVMGYGVFVIVLGGVLGAISLLKRWWPELEIADRGSRIADSDNPKSEIRNPKAAAAIAGIVIAIAVGEMVFLRHLANLPPRGGAGVALAADGAAPVELPAFIGTEWIGRRGEVTAIEREILPADTGFSRKNYVPLADPRKQVFLSIVLSGRDRTSIHRPELCLVGQGWSVAETAAHAFRFPGPGGGGFRATLLRVRREVQTSRGKEIVPQLVAYWFVSADSIEPTHGRMFLRDAWNRVFRARADRWAYVLMQTDAADGEAPALQRLQTVLDGTLPTFQRSVAAR